MDQQNPKTRPDPGHLFRPEAVAAQHHSALGHPIAAIPATWTAITAILVALVATALVFVSTATFSRKETAIGIVRHSLGDFRLKSPVAGAIDAVLVVDGQYVTKGSELVRIAPLNVIQTGTMHDSNITRILRQQIQIIKNEMAAIEKQEASETGVMRAKLQALKTNLRYERSKRNATRIQLEELEKQVARVDAMRKKKYASLTEEINSRKDYFSLLVALKESESSIATLEADIDKQKILMGQLPSMIDQKRNGYLRDLKDLQRELATYEGAQIKVIESPIDGVVSSIQKLPGQQVNQNDSLLLVSPENGELVAEVYIQSSAIGFVSEGKAVRLLYDAFPYERYGAGSGEVIALSRSVVEPSEIIGGLPKDRSYYRAIVAIDEIHMKVHGKDERIRSGMAVRAEIILDRQSIAAWLFEPLMALKRRIGELH